MKDSEESFEIKDTSSTKMNNIANAYAWWIAKGCVTLSVFKVRSSLYLYLSRD